uniref:Uncharacterized protein n=1 Tax=Heterorhabditis bacteriophora TaxID=37862 RepID=A0A1I7WNQ5_HETBA
MFLLILYHSHIVSINLFLLT